MAPCNADFSGTWLEKHLGSHSCVLVQPELDFTEVYWERPMTADTVRI